MRLKDNLDVGVFLAEVGECKGEVIFETKENDRLNLKSTLAKFVFAAIADKPEFMEISMVRCSEPEDEKRLSKFFIEDLT